MRRTALILAAHGSRVDPGINARIRKYAARLATRTSFDDVTAAFHQGAPPFATVLDDLQATEIVVVPVMTCRGYYSDVILPTELAKNQRHSEVRLRWMEPLGRHPDIPMLVGTRIQTLSRLHNLELGRTSVAVVGHGTTQHRTSRIATLELANDLRKLGILAEVLPAFLDEYPLVESVVDQARNPTIVVVPFLIADGVHATRDIPRRIGLDVSGKETLPICGAVHDRTIFCDLAVGSYPEIPDLLASMVEAVR